VPNVERAGCGAAQGDQHSTGVQRCPQVARDAADVGALPARNAQVQVGPLVASDHEFVDLDRAGLEFNATPFAGDVVGALAADLEGGKIRRALLDRAAESRRGGLDF